MARRSKYTPELVQQICEILAEGNTRRTACVLAGVSEDTFYTWLRAKPEFAERIKAAEQAAIRRNVEIIQTAAQKHWQAARVGERIWWRIAEACGRDGILHIAGDNLRLR